MYLRLIHPQQSVLDLQRKNSTQFVEWIPDNVSVTLCTVPPVGQTQVCFPFHHLVNSRDSRRPAFISPPHALPTPRLSKNSSSAICHSSLPCTNVMPSCIGTLAREWTPWSSLKPRAMLAISCKLSISASNEWDTGPRCLAPSTNRFVSDIGELSHVLTHLLPFSLVPRGNNRG